MLAAQIARLAVGLAGFSGVLLCHGVWAAPPELPEGAARAIRANFPGLAVTGVGRERERGAWYYEVNLKGGGRHFGVEVTEEGVIGEIEGVVKFGDLPDELLQKARERVGSGHVTRVEKHERRGIARNGKLVPLSEPRISYDVKYVDASGQRREFQLASNQILELPDAVRKQIEGRFAGAKITEVEAEDDEGVIIHAVTLSQQGETFELDALADGRIIAMETAAQLSSVPKHSLALVQSDKGVRTTDVQRLYRRETWATVEKGRLVERRDVTYIIRVFRKDAEREYRFDSRGRLLNRPAWQDRADDDESAEGGDDDDEGGTGRHGDHD